MPARVGRLQIQLQQGAIYLTREPDPNCLDCSGSRGGWVPIGGDVDWGECSCLDQLRTWHLRLWPRRTPAKEYPF
jgi:hypothetical protein